MAMTFSEDNTIEQMIISTLKSNGWKYIPAEELPRMHSDVLVEPMVKELYRAVLLILRKERFLDDWCNNW